MDYLSRPANCLHRVVPDYPDILALNEDGDEAGQCPSENERYGAVDDCSVDEIGGDAKQKEAYGHLDHARCPEEEKLGNVVQLQSHSYGCRIKVGRVSTGAVCDLAKG